MLNRLTRGLGLYLIGGAIVSGVLVWFILLVSEGIAGNPPYDPERIPSAAHWIIDHRVYSPVLSVPAFMLGIVVLRTARRSWLLLLLGSLALLLPFGVILWCFIALVAPMYEVQPLT